MVQLQYNVTLHILLFSGSVTISALPGLPSQTFQSVAIAGYHTFANSDLQVSGSLGYVSSTLNVDNNKWRQLISIAVLHANLLPPSECSRRSSNQIKSTQILLLNGFYEATSKIQYTEIRSCGSLESI